MSKLNDSFEDMPRSKAVEFVEDNFDALENTYYSNEPPSGVAGKIWRYFWGSPRRISPVSYYMAFKLSELHNEQSDKIKQERKIAREKERKKLSNYIDRLSGEKHGLEVELQASVSNVEKLDKELLDREREKSFLLGELRDLQTTVASSENKLRMDAYLKDIKELAQRLAKHERLDLNDLASYRLKYKLDYMDSESSRDEDNS